MMITTVNRTPIKSTNIDSMKNQVVNYFFLALMLVLVSCAPETEEAAAEAAPEPSAEAAYELTPQQFQASQMSLGEMEKETFHAVVKAKGIMDVPPKNRAEVSSFFGGTVQGIRILPGERVRKGQVLFVLENPDYVQIQQDYLEAMGQLAYLKSDYERQKNLAQDSVSSQKKYLKAESDYRVTQAKLAALAKKLTLMKMDPTTLTLDNIHTTIAVTAPISGYVTEVMIAEGTYLTPPRIAVKIVNTDHLHLELDVFENDLAKISIGQPIRFSIQEDGSATYEAKVQIINKNVDPERRTVGIHGHLVDESLREKLIPGMYVEADIYTTSEERWALPREALVDVEGKFYLLVLTEQSDAGYTFVKKEVKTGLSNRTQIEILNAREFAQDTRFLVQGAFNLITE